jgi:hypothetical protein
VSSAVRVPRCLCVDLPRGAGRSGTIRDRLTGRTPRSERGDRGSIPCPGVVRSMAIVLADDRHARGPLKPVALRSDHATGLSNSPAHMTHIACPQVAERQTRGVESAVEDAREGSTPSLDIRGRVAQWRERLSYKQEAAGSSPALPMSSADTDRRMADRYRESQRRSRARSGRRRPCRDPSTTRQLVVEAQPVERPPETRGVAGSIPADHAAPSPQVCDCLAATAHRPKSPEAGRFAAGSQCD